MAMRVLTLMIFTLLIPFYTVFAQPYNAAIDVRHYDFSLDLTDSNNIIHGQAAITLQFKENTPDFTIDLARRNDEGKGMTVIAVKEGNKTLRFTQNNQQLIIHTPGNIGEKHTYTIRYEGIPADGLIIANNKFGH